MALAYMKRKILSHQPYKSVQWLFQNAIPKKFFVWARKKVQICNISTLHESRRVSPEPIFTKNFSHIKHAIPVYHA